MAKAVKASAAEEDKKPKKTAQTKKVKETTPKVQPEVEAEATVEKAGPTKKKATKESETNLTADEKAQSSDVIARLVKSSKQQIIVDYALKDGDTGSPEVQIALATQKVFNLASHLEENPKDNHSRRGLLKVIAKRRRILHYLMGKDEARYKQLTKKLGLKK